MGEPGRVHPSMTKADTWPLSPVETVLVATLVYVVLLIALAVPRWRGHAEAARPVAAPAALVQAGRPAAQVRTQASPPAAEVRGEASRPAAEVRGQAVLAGCVTARTTPEAYAASPRVTQPMAFGPPVEPTGLLPVAEVNGQLWLRLCGGVAAPGGPRHGPDRRLFVALDAVVNHRDPNRTISRAEWAAGVDRFIANDALWDRASVVTRNVPSGTPTFGMVVRPGTDPLVVRTRLAHPSASRYLVLPVRGQAGDVVTLSLRLLCGFQPVL